MNPSRCFATIVSPNYLAYARVLQDSLADHARGSPLEVLVVGRDDAVTRAAIAESGVAATLAGDLGLPDFEHLAYKFDIVEFNTALKPTFLKSLLARGFDEVIYLDPDIQLFDAPSPVFEALNDGEIVLTPHSLAPVLDGSRPSDIDFLRGGVFNLGFVALRRGSQSDALLDWWEQRCLSHGFNDTGFGTFVDQKWMDLAPAYFERVKILKHPGCNVAYWNLHERVVDEAQGHLRANGEPLMFFHFSGVDVRTPHLLSRHQNRHVPAPGSLLARLVREYCDRLTAAGHAKWSSLPYAFGMLDDGTPITSAMRRAACVDGVDTSRPFDPDSPLQRALRRVGAHPKLGRSRAPVTTLNVDVDDARIRAANALVRVAARMMGAGRMADAIRYATFLSWSANFPAVLLKQPFELRHIDRREGDTK